MQAKIRASKELRSILKTNCTENDILLVPRGKASNHVSHDLIAMWQAGATGQQLEMWYTTYKNIGSGYGKVGPITGKPNSITVDNWRSHLGEENWAGWITFFQEENDRLGGIEPLLRTYCAEDVLGSNICAHLLHALISIGYGLLAGSPEVVAEGFAQITWKWTVAAPLPELTELRRNSKETSTVAELLSCIEAFSTDPRAYQARSKIVLDDTYFIAHELCPFLAEYEAMFVPGPCASKEEIEETCNRLANVAFYVFYLAGSKDFVILHLVTSAPALRTLCLALPPSFALPLMRRWWSYLLLCYLYKGCPKYSAVSSQASLPWSTLSSLGFEHNDEHTVKGVFACLQAVEDGIVAKEVEPYMREIAETLLTIPSPPALKKRDAGDWIYASMGSPWATLVEASL